MDSLPPQPPPAYAAAPSDIYPRSADEQALCAEASHPDWFYLGGMLVLDVGAIGVGSNGDLVKGSSSVPVRMLIGPGLIGLAWGFTVGGTWLALPKCEPHWVGEAPPEGRVRATWPLAISLALLAGATAPIVNAIAIGPNLPPEWTTEERAMHLVVAGVAGFGGALLPYLLPPRTWAAARELDRLRFGTDGRGSAYVGYTVAF